MRRAIASRLLILFCAFPSVATACQCTTELMAEGLQHPRTMRQWSEAYLSNFERLSPSGAIFEGEVEEQVLGSYSHILPGRIFGDYRLVTVRATSVYRGPKQQKFEVRTGLGGGDCGVDFETGGDYLIYASRDDEGMFFTDICWRTARVEDAGPDLRVLRGEPPAQEDLLDRQSYRKRFLAERSSGVCGRVARSDGTPAGGALVYLSRERHDGFSSRPLAAYSSPQGDFCFEHVWRGAYLLFSLDDNGIYNPQVANTMSQFWRPLRVWAEPNKDVSGLVLVLHENPWHSARRIVRFLLFLIAVGLVLTFAWTWLVRRRSAV